MVLQAGKILGDNKNVEVKQVMGVGTHQEAMGNLVGFMDTSE